MTFPLLDQRDSFVSGSDEDLSGTASFETPFEIYAPAAFEQARSVLSVEAISDLVSLGEARSSVERTSLANLYSGVFDESSDGDNLITPDQANAQFGYIDNGQQMLSFNKPISAKEAEFIRDKKIREVARMKILERLNGVPWVTSLGVELLADLGDPLGLMTLFIPVAKARTFISGAREAALAAGITIAPGTFKNTQIQAQFQAQEAVLTLIGAGALGGVINKATGVFSRELPPGIEDVNVADAHLTLSKSPPGDPPPPGSPPPSSFNDTFPPALIHALNGNENVAEAIAEHSRVLKDIDDLESIQEIFEELVALRKEVGRQPDSPEKDAQLKEMSEIFIELKNKQTDIKRKGDAKRVNVQDIKSGLEQDEPDAPSILTGEEKVTRIKTKQDPEAKESRQADELQDLAASLEAVVRPSHKSGRKDSITTFISALRRVLGGGDNYDELLQAALDDPSILTEIFARLEKLRVNETDFSKAGGFEPRQLGGGMERDKSQGDFFYKTPVKDAPRSDVKREIRTALNYVQAKVARAGSAPFPVSKAPLEKAARDLKKVLTENQEDGLPHRQNEPIEEPPDVDVPPTESVFDLTELNDGFEVLNVNSVKDATNGEADSLEDLEELLQDLYANPKATEKDIEDMTNLIKILKEKSTALEELPKKVDGIQDALNCALGGD